MKRLYLIVLMALGIALGSMAQTDALVVEQNNGLADILKVSANLRIENNTDGTISVKDGNNIVATYARADIKRIAFNDEKALTDSVERAALIALYNATDGANWTNNTNWCSEKPLNEWYGITTNEGHVTRISVGRNNLRGTIPAELGNLTKLTQLYLSYNSLSGEIPAELGSLHELMYLGLSYNELTGNIPDALKNLSKLEDFSVTQNLLTGSIPKWIGNFEHLRTLNLNYNNFSGEIPSELGKLSELYYFSLGGIYRSNIRLVGEIPKSFGELKKLGHLEIVNTGLTGSLPAGLGNLSELTYLQIDENSFSGEIPAELANLSNLEVLRLNGNDFSGKIPAELGNLTKLTELGLGHNNLTDVIPAKLGNLSNLTRLNLYENKLSGKIPAEIGNLTNLTSLDLYVNNLSGAIPVEFGNLTKLTYLNLRKNNLSGEIPAELGNLTNLTSLDLSSNNLSGKIPAELGNLTNLTRLYLNINSLSGEIPVEFGNLTKLMELNLSSNSLSGEIPESFNYLQGLIQYSNYDEKNIFKLYTNNNNLSGRIPSLFTNNPAWYHEWPWILYDCHNYNIEEDVYIPAPSFRVKDIDSNILESKDIYPKNKYTVIFHWATWCPYSNAAMNDIIPLYKKYEDSGLEIIGYTSQEEEQVVRDFIRRKNIKWNNFLSTKDNSLDYRSSFLHGLYGDGYPDRVTPEIAVVNSNGRVVFIDCINKRSDLISFLENKLGPESDIEIYNSTDFSADGKTTLLQNATTSKDIKVVIMGDGFSDRMIANGTYDKTMKKAMEALFTTEPIKNFRDRFSVTSVTVVSKNELFSDTTQTALGCYNNINGIGGNHSKVFHYAKTAIGEEAMDDAIIIVVLNSELSIASKIGGICYMYSPENKNNWGSGASISYIPNISGVYNELSFDNVLSHEAVGHGFAKLGDEYINKEEPIPAASIEEYKDEFILGWWKNADFTNNPTEVKWREFISDARYADEGIGIYEGGLTYPSGVYRPTENSIMSSDDTDFNAPSRQAIWYRINKLTQGANWEGTYEDFVQFDKATYGAQASARRTQKQTEDSRIRRTEELRTAPPVVKTITWREEK